MGSVRIIIAGIVVSLIILLGTTVTYYKYKAERAAVTIEVQKSDIETTTISTRATTQIELIKEVYNESNSTEYDVSFDGLY